MENLNAEQIIKALECCAYGYCRDCDLYSDDGCGNKVLVGAINVIKELTEENERLSQSLANVSQSLANSEAENERLRGERAKFFEYKHGTLVRNALVSTKNKKEFDEFCEAIKADTVRKMHERLKAKAVGFPNYTGEVIAARWVDRIAKEMLEGNNES